MRFDDLFVFTRGQHKKLSSSVRVNAQNPQFVVIGGCVGPGRYFKEAIPAGCEFKFVRDSSLLKFQSKIALYVNRLDSDESVLPYEYHQ